MLDVAIIGNGALAAFATAALWSLIFLSSLFFKTDGEITLMTGRGFFSRCVFLCILKASGLICITFLSSITYGMRKNRKRVSAH
jgi:hypothetical protein